MKHKTRFVTPRVIQSVRLYPETDMLLLPTSTDDAIQFTSIGHEEVTYEEGDDYTIDLY